MSDFLEKLKLALNQLEETQGDFFLFAIFQREDNPLRLWDLLVSAPGLDAEGSLKMVCSVIQECLKGNDVRKLSHVVILDQNEPIVQYLRETYDVPNGHPAEIIDCETLSERLPFTIQRAYLLRCLKTLSV